MKPKRSMFDRFVERVRFTEVGCWEWQKTLNSVGYGLIADDEGKYALLHRWAYEFFVGPIPVGLLVLHRCDNRPCANPDHLFLGTQKVNRQDAVAKGRVPRGEDCPQAKLTWDSVAEIRRAYPAVTQDQLAAQYGVSQVTISRIVRERMWRPNV